MKKTINTKEVFEDGMDIEADTADDPVLREILQGALGENYSTEDSAHLKIFLMKAGDAIDVDAEVDLKLKIACGKCLEPFKMSMHIPFHMLMAPLYRKRRNQERDDPKEREVVSDDVEFSFFEGEALDLAELVREQIVLGQPMNYICRQSCKGLCPNCGENLNKGKCGCSREKKPSPFEVLKALKPVKKTPVKKNASARKPISKSKQ